MTYRWRNLLGTAALLMKSPTTDEATFRTVINRSYYATYGEAKALASRCGYVYQPRRGGSHQQVWNFIRDNLPAKPPHIRQAGRAISAQAQVLKSFRVLADYELDPPVTRQDAERSIELANRTVSRILGL